MEWSGDRLTQYDHPSTTSLNAVAALLADGPGALPLVETQLA